MPTNMKYSNARLVMQKKHLRIGPYDYTCFIGSDCTAEISARIAGRGYESTLVVTDPMVWRLHGGKLKQTLSHYLATFVLQVQHGEGDKTVAHMAKFLDQAIDMGINGSSCVVTLGGGVPGNIGGLISALLFRGLPLIHLPTTTVAMFDSAISVRQSVNPVHGKNLIGTFYCPQAVFYDLSYLRTLPKERFQEGMIELVKGAMVCKGDALVRLKSLLPYHDVDSYEELLLLAIDVKVNAIQDDPHENAEGLRLHYGHTIGHALEHLADGRLSHGQAVAIGMECAGSISSRLGYLRAEDLAVHNQLIEAVYPTLSVPSPLDIGHVLRLLFSDAKQGYIARLPGHVPLVLLERLGCPVYTQNLPLVQVPLEVVGDVLKESKMR